MMLLVPADPLRPRRPDEHFRAEAVAAGDAGLDVAVVDHDALTMPGRADQAVELVPAGGEAVYRGWMLRSEQYAAFAEALARRGVTLRTSPEQYQRAHELPGWYAALAAHPHVDVDQERPARRLRSGTRRVEHRSGRPA
ncbi:hypothetical protein ACFFMR_05290 [Micromonospora andamanensis]|uniref:hypothetical protein n=1 Tax=Micromonospora andamanensis TaxID=1287068 RepID=UPI001EF2F277|nr:hypothetical protein [Micromonospora andamanensis]